MAKKLEDVLVEGEQVYASAHLHKAVFLFPGFLIVLGALVWELFHPVVGAAIFFVTLYPLLNAFIRYKTTMLVLTGKRVLLIYGYFNEDVVQFKLNKIESASLENPLLGRIIGFATVVIRGVGTGAVPVTYVLGGQAFVREVEKRLLENDS